MPDESPRLMDERLRVAVDSAPSGLLMTDADGRIVLVNCEVERLFGYPREELLGRSVDLLVPDAARQQHAGYRKGFLQSPKVRVMGAGRELFGRRKDGSAVPVEIGLTPVITTEGLFVLSSVVDISERKRAEQERRLLEDQLRQSQKLEAIGTLAGGIAHDFNNLLGSIVGHAEMLQGAVRNDPTASADVAEVLHAAQRGRRLVERILAFSRRQAVERNPVELGETVRAAHQLLRATIPATVELRLDLPVEPHRVLADETSVHQVLMNLVTNAVHAMPSGGLVEIALRPTYVRDSVARANSALHEGPYALLSVRDTGTGIDPEHRARVFEPFFTTKPPGTGTGLGLSMVHAIMQDHEGTITLESQLGEGTTATCFFPEITAEPPVAAVPAAPLPQGKGERILYVDDEPSLTRIGVRRLEGINYQVTGVLESRDALKHFRAEPASFALVIADFTMPGMTGLELGKELRKIRADIPVILLTGFIDDMDDALLRASGVARVLHKPVSQDELARAVREVIDAA